jgi:hypothetical protein
MDKQTHTASAGHTPTPQESRWLRALKDDMATQHVKWRVYSPASQAHRGEFRGKWTVGPEGLPPAAVCDEEKDALRIMREHNAHDALVADRADLVAALREARGALAWWRNGRTAKRRVDALAVIDAALARVQS